MAENTASESNGTAESPVLRMQKMYLKDFSFENPNSPEIFRANQRSEPKVELNLQLNNKKIGDDHWEVAIEINAKVVTKEEDPQVLFILEVEQQRVQGNKAVAAPGTHGMDEATVARIGRRFNADYIVRGRILEYKTRQDPTWEPWKKGFLPFLLQGTSRIAVGFAGADKYDRYGQMAAGATYGALIGYQTIWPFDNNTLFGASSATSNAIFWGAVGATLGDLSYNSGRVDQAVVQMRIWVQEAATGNLVWTNRIRVSVSPETVYADNQYDALFNSAIEKSVSTLIDNFVTYGL